jgi:hypothetical protein
MPTDEPENIPGAQKRRYSVGKMVSWFGYKLHLLVDALYELPVAFAVTKASASDVKEGHALIDRLAKERPALVERCEALLADKAYDDTKLIVKLWDEHRIKPVIDIRNQWRDGEETRVLAGKKQTSMIIVARSTVTVPGRTNAGRWPTGDLKRTGKP